MTNKRGERKKLLKARLAAETRLNNRCQYHIYGCDQAQHIGRCQFSVPDYLHEYLIMKDPCGEPLCKSVPILDGIPIVQVLDTPVTIPETHLWKHALPGPDGTLYLSVMELISKDRTGRITLRGADDRESSKLSKQQFANHLIIELLSSGLNFRGYALNIPPPDYIEDTFQVPRFLSEGRLITKMGTSINATPQGTFVDLHIDRGMSTISVSPRDQYGRGVKLWLLFPPSPANRDTYIQAAQRPDGQRFQTFKSHLRGCQYAITTQVLGIYIPAGWLHCVYTITPSLLVGSNFAIPETIGAYSDAILDESKWNRSPEDLRDSLGAFARAIYPLLVDGQSEIQAQGRDALRVLFRLEVQARLDSITRWPTELLELLTRLAEEGDPAMKCFCGMALSPKHIRVHTT